MKDGTYLMGKDGSLTPIEISSGYWVAEEEISLSDTPAGTIVGVWTDENGKVWTDKSYLVSDLDEALSLADKWKQLAIWDNQKQKSVYLNK